MQREEFEKTDVSISRFYFIVFKTTHGNRPPEICSAKDFQRTFCPKGTHGISVQIFLIDPFFLTGYSVLVYLSLKQDCYEKALRIINYLMNREKVPYFGYFFQNATLPKTVSSVWQ